MKRSGIKTMVHVQVSAEDLISNMLMINGREELFQFIVDADLAAADWGFTLRLADHFDRLRKEHAEEEKEDQ